MTPTPTAGTGTSDLPALLDEAVTQALTREMVTALVREGFSPVMATRKIWRLSRDGTPPSRPRLRLVAQVSSESSPDEARKLITAMSERFADTGRDPHALRRDGEEVGDDDGSGPGVYDAPSRATSAPASPGTSTFR